MNDSTATSDGAIHHIQVDRRLNLRQSTSPDNPKNRLVGGREVPGYSATSPL